MKPAAQVLHVMAKDVHENRWALAVYGALTIVTTVSAIRADQNGPAVAIAMPLLVLFGMIAVAALVQGDSPVRVDAFWASRPLDPIAVLTAKLALTVIAMIGVPLAGQLVALIAHGTPGSELPAALLASAWAYWKWLLIALVIGAITTDVKSFLITLVTIPAVLFLWAWIGSMGNIGNVIVEEVADLHHPLRDWSVMVAGMVGCMALLAILYRNREGRPAMWVAALALLLLTRAATGPLPAVTTSAQLADDGSFAHTTFRAGQNVVGMNGVRQFGVTLSPDSLPQLQRLTLVDGVVSVTDRTGATLRAPFSANQTDLRFHGHSLTNVTWLGEPPDGTGTYGGGTVYFNDSLRHIVGRGVASIGIEGRMIVRVPGTIDTIDLRNGSYALRRGATIRISRLQSADKGETFNVAITSAASADAEKTQSHVFPPSDIEYTLLNERRHEALTLDFRGGGMQTNSLVLPGVEMATMAATLATPTNHLAQLNAQLSEDWLRGTRLVVTRWVPKGSYPVHIETKQP